MARFTTNYNLPIEDERYVSLEAMLKVALEGIDTVVKGVDDRLAAAEVTILDHEARITTLEP